MVSVTMSARGVGLDDDSDPREASWTAPRASSGRTARGKPPSPFIGSGYVWAFQLVVFGSALLQQWACG
jgi:hypothetical protein